MLCVRNCQYNHLAKCILQENHTHADAIREIDSSIFLFPLFKYCYYWPGNMGFAVNKVARKFPTVFCAWMALQFQKCENKLREKLGSTKVRCMWTLDLNVRFTISGIYANGLHCRTWPGGATVARLTPVQKVACSNHVRVTIFFGSSFFKSLIWGELENSPYLIHILELRFTGLSLRIQRIQKMWKSHRSALR